jgi:hypothetical protein
MGHPIYGSPNRIADIVVRMTAVRPARISEAIVRALTQKRGNIIPWNEVKSLLSEGLGGPASGITLSAVTHSNYRVRLTQPGFNRDIDLGVFVSDVRSPFTEGVRLGLHECRKLPQFALLVLQQDSSHQYHATDLVLGPRSPSTLAETAAEIWPGIKVWSYESVWR